ncbi:hypothetical protein L484_008018 [Morus notabilis]|uniref:Uncharacterized protein n=1 Tax=Morus notabilis TaxID=981085 RepID=W9R587_9ROSA|nr:hypothetical protein L484_008018 [Morus notabilis]
MKSSPSSSTLEVQPKNIKHETLLQIPLCRVHLMDEGEALELTNGDFKLTRILDDNLSFATIIRVREYLTWPLTKDEPVVRDKRRPSVDSSTPCPSGTGGLR